MKELLERNDTSKNKERHIKRFPSVMTQTVPMVRS